MMDGCCRFLGRRITMLFSLPSSRCVHFEPFVPIPFVCPWCFSVVVKREIGIKGF